MPASGRRNSPLAVGGAGARGERQFLRGSPVRESTALATLAPDPADTRQVLDDGQIVVELASGETEPPKRFDLDGHTVVFTPDGNGGYALSVRSLDSEDDIGPEVPHDSQIPLENLEFDFAECRWSSTRVRRGAQLRRTPTYSGCTGTTATR